MYLKARVEKLEVATKQLVEGPKLVWVREDQDEKKVVAELKAKYGRDYEPPMLIVVERNPKYRVTLEKKT